MLTAHPSPAPVAGLHPAPPGALPFGGDLVARAFLLERPGGNLLLHGAPGLTAAAPELAALGGARWLYLGHWHEALFEAGDAARALGAHVVVHAADAAETQARTGMAPETFTERHALGEGFELVPMPGHTPGSTAFLWDHDDHRVLFTADTVTVRDGEWVAAVLGSSDRGAYLESLDLLRGLDFDVLVPWAATAGEPWAIATDPADARRRLSVLMDRVWAGASS